MIQREDIVLLGGTAAGAALIALGHQTEGLYILMAGVGGKALIPAISPGVTTVTQPAPLPSPVTTTIDGKVYVKQADGSFKPQ